MYLLFLFYIVRNLKGFGQISFILCGNSEVALSLSGDGFVEMDVPGVIPMCPGANCCQETPADGHRKSYFVRPHFISSAP